MTKEGREGGDSLTPRVSPKVSLYQAAKQLLDLAVRIERARTDAEENRLCDERDALLAKFRAADTGIPISAPVGEASANPDLVEGIARDIHWATTLMRPNSPTFDELYPDVKETMRTLARAALNHISSLGMVVVPSSVLTPRDDSHLVLQLRDTASRIADVDDHLVVHLAADALEARTVSVSDMGIPMSASVGEANPPRDERAVTDNGWQPIETAPCGEVIRYEPAEYRRGQLSLPARIVISGGLYPRKATHWMPLPAFPKDRGEA